jgi:hypothetical protein
MHGHTGKVTAERMNHHPDSGAGKFLRNLDIDIISVTEHRFGWKPGQCVVIPDIPDFSTLAEG